MCACRPQVERPTPTPPSTPVVTAAPTPEATPDPVAKETPEPTATETPEPERPVDYVSELPVDEHARRMILPSFLSREQKELYQKANTLYRALLGTDSRAIDSFGGQENGAPVGGTVELNGMIYRISGGRYAKWEVFDGIVHGLFTEDFWQARNRTEDGAPIFREHEGKMVYLELARESGAYYKGHKFELVSQTGDEIIFTLQGIYRIPVEDEDDRDYNDFIQYTDEFTIHMVRTEDGWRFNEFYDAKADERSLNCRREESEAPEVPEELVKEVLLPIYPHTMAAGSTDLYAVTREGALLMWGAPEFTHGLCGGVPGGEPVVLRQENVVSVYCGIRGTVMFIDREGTLWQLDGKENPHEPVWVMDDVAMVSIKWNYGYILKRDGTLWHWGGPEGFPGFYNYRWADPDDPERPAQWDTLTKIMDNVVWVELNDTGSGGGWALTADGALWEWFSSPKIRKVSDRVNREELEHTLLIYHSAPGMRKADVEALYSAFGPAVRIENGYVLQENGTLWYFDNDDYVLVKYLEDVEQMAASQSGILFRRIDGSCWLRNNYNEDGSYRSLYEFDPVKVLAPME